MPTRMPTGCRRNTQGCHNDATRMPTHGCHKETTLMPQTAKISAVPVAYMKKLLGRVGVSVIQIGFLYRRVVTKMMPVTPSGIPKPLP